MMSAMSGFAFIQRALFARKAKAPVPSPPVPGPPPGITVRNDAPVQSQNNANTMSVTQHFGQRGGIWIDITVLDDGKRVKQLQAGKSYTVKLSCSLNRPDQPLHEAGIIVVSSLELEFYSQTNSSELAAQLEREETTFTLTYVQAAGFTGEFLLTLPARQDQALFRGRLPAVESLAAKAARALR